METLEVDRRNGRPSKRVKDEMMTEVEVLLMGVSSTHLTVQS
jgi:hypothetical protein